MADREIYYDLVVIGASAGGIEALSTLLSTLPADFPAPVVLAQHLDPTRESHLTEILQRRSALPVRTVVDHEPLQRGVVFVVPANRHVEIGDSAVIVHSEGAGRLKPSVDLLLSTAAATYGERLIAVILTGQGSDGAAGAREVKGAGGTVIIQNPAIASFPSMPLSLAPTNVDVVADLETIGPLLNDLVTGAQLPSRPDETRALRSLLEGLREQSGIDFTAYKMPTILRRLQRRMAATGTARLDEYIRYLQAHPEEYLRLVSSFLIKVTEFFRDPELFAYLREHVLPDLVAQARTRGNELRIWSAGCATGEEAYALAILVADLLGDEIDRFSVRIFATDLDADAVAIARRGIYPATAVAALPPDLVERYFSRINDEYEIQKRVRALMVFGQHDLGQRAPFPRIDLILCRNVLIFFTAELQKRALQLFAFSLRDGAYLVLGKAESTSSLGEFFAMEQPHLKVYRRQGDRVLIPPSRIRGATPTLPTPLVPQRRSLSGNDLSRGTQEIQRTHVSGEKLVTLLLRLPFGVAVIDARYDIHFINNAARRLLGIHGAAIGEDLVHLAHVVPSDLLRNAIDRAFREKAPADVAQDIAVEMPSGETSYLRISCFPQPLESDGESIESVLVLVVDGTADMRERQELLQATARQQGEIARQAALIERLVENNRQLLEANQELATANGELRSANEEFLVSNEEVQAASEEVETLNEELQATNEELETLNEELQATVEELNTTNDDLQARSVELQELAVSLDEQRQTSEAERARLQAVLLNIGDAVLVVDRSGKTVLTNAAYERIFGGALPDPVLEGEDGRRLPGSAAPWQRAARGETFTSEFFVTGADGVRRRYEASGRPVRGDTGEQGGVVSIRDITERSAPS